MVSRFYGCRGETDNLAVFLDRFFRIYPLEGDLVASRNRIPPNYDFVADSKVQRFRVRDKSRGGTGLPRSRE